MRFRVMDGDVLITVTDDISLMEPPTARAYTADDYVKEAKKNLLADKQVTEADLSRLRFVVVPNERALGSR